MCVAGASAEKKVGVFALQPNLRGAQAGEGLTMIGGSIALERVSYSANAPGRPTRICVGIATCGRPQQLRIVVDHLRQQTLQPSNVILSCFSSDDAGELAARDDLLILYGPAGAARQRNVVSRNFRRHRRGCLLRR